MLITKHKPIILQRFKIRRINRINKLYVVFLMSENAIIYELQRSICNIVKVNKHHSSMQVFIYTLQ